MAQIKILYEDNQIVVAEKPQGMLSQSDSTGDRDILSHIKKYIKEKYSKPGEAYIGLVHRLDRPTGGIMVFARTSKAAKRLQQQIKSGSFEKSYLAVVSGNPGSGSMENWLLKDTQTNTVKVCSESVPGAKRALLFYQTLETHDDLSLVKIKLETGRSHQIRVQFSHAGHPLFGDARYGNIKGDLALWACTLSFVHPVSHEEMTFVSDPPDTGIWQKFSSKKNNSAISTVSVFRILTGILFLLL